MPQRNADLHGNVPDRAHTALLLIDVINDLAFTDGAKLLRYAVPMAQRLATLKRRAKAAGFPVIYANDNFGKWQSDFSKLLRHCLADESRGREVVQLLSPEDDDYFVLKPKHSAFFATTLETLLKYLEVQQLILTGMAGNICVLFTANDAYMRDYGLIVPSDCVASNSETANRYALKQMERVLKADVRPAAKIDFSRLPSK